jgi:hypothetical protein
VGDNPVVTLGFQLQREILVSRADNPAVKKHVDKVRHDVIQQALVVRDDELAGSCKTENEK